tara:strand:+ start:303 stop:470 length:168 start_codon:yes stop_codon:yes gene_type:complete
MKGRATLGEIIIVAVFLFVPGYSTTANVDPVGDLDIKQACAIAIVKSRTKRKEKE